MKGYGYTTPLGGGGAAGPSVVGHNQQTQQLQVAKLYQD